MKDLYDAKVAAEKLTFESCVDVHNLPNIFHYWSHRYLRPLLECYGISSVDQFFASYLHESAIRCGASAPRFVSIGAGNCDTEIRVARLLKNSGLRNFSIDCLELNDAMLDRGKAEVNGDPIAAHVNFIAVDANSWSPETKYDGAMANHSLHHIVELEHLFEITKAALRRRSLFAISDMIGRNGHMRWPEAMPLVQGFWDELPSPNRFNMQLNRQEELFENWDCSVQGFEGIRAQDILPLLVQEFDFRLFIGFANIISVFIDRSFGHHFSDASEWDRNFIDRVQAADEAAILSGILKPTQMFAVVTPDKSPIAMYSRGLSPRDAIRDPSL